MQAYNLSDILADADRLLLVGGAASALPLNPHSRPARSNQARPLLPRGTHQISTSGPPHFLPVDKKKPAGLLIPGGLFHLHIAQSIHNLVGPIISHRARPGKQHVNVVAERPPACAC